MQLVREASRIIRYAFRNVYWQKEQKTEQKWNEKSVLFAICSIVSFRCATPRLVQIDNSSGGSGGDNSTDTNWNVLWIVLIVYCVSSCHTNNSESRQWATEREREREWCEGAVDKGKIENRALIGLAPTVSINMKSRDAQRNRTNSNDIAVEQWQQT